MAMDPLLVAAIKAGAPVVHLVTVTLPDHIIRWTDGGYVKWGDDTWRVTDATYGALDSIGSIVDGVEEDAEPVALSIIAPNLESLADLAAADAQGGRVAIHLTALGTAGLVIGEPYRLFIGDLDQPVLRNGRRRRLDYDVLPLDARGLEDNEEQRQTHAFRQAVWPGELGDQYATDGTKLTYWREDEPKNSLGPLLGRGVLGQKLEQQRNKDNKAIEFTYEPEAPLAFPFGRCAIKGSMRWRTGYGPTNRYHSYVATIGASGPVQGKVSIEVDEEIITFDGNDRAENGAHDHAMWVRYDRGLQPAAALTSPVGASSVGFPAPGWTEDHKLSGRPAIMWTGVENSKKSEYGGGLPPVIIVQDGLYGWDPRSGDDWDDRAAWPGLKDGGLTALSWTMGRWEGASGEGTYGVPYRCWLVGGIGTPLDGIDVDAFAAAADIADDLSWRVAGVAFSDEGKVEVLEDLLAAAGARRSRKCGQVSCVSYAAVSESVLTVTEDDTAGDVEAVLYPSRLDRRNTGIGRFLSPGNRWEITALAPVGNPDWVAADGGRRPSSYDFRFVTSADQAAALTYLWLAYDRAGTGDVPLKLYMLQLEVGDCFDWDAPSLLLDGVKARVEKREYDPTRLDLKVRYRIVDDQDVEDALGEAGDPPPPTDPGIPPPTYVEPPTDGMITTDGSSASISYRNPISVQYDLVNLFRAIDSTDFADAMIINYYAGSPGEYVTIMDSGLTAGHSYSYWPIAIDAQGENSDPAQPGLPLTIEL